MSAASNTLIEAEKLLATLPDVSRPLIAKYFRQGADVLQKADDSPVTIADKSVEAILRRTIDTHFPDHAIIGEEEGGLADKPYCWVIDPIDGTRAFITGKPLFGTLVALVHDGAAICAMIDMPELDECYLTRGGAAYLRKDGHEEALKTRQTADLGAAHIATTSPDAFTSKGWKIFQHLSAQCLSPHYGGDCYNYALLAAGHMDLVVEHQLAPHDIMALVPVMEAAGAIVTDWQGMPIRLDSDGSILAAANKTLHALALSEIQQVAR